MQSECTINMTSCKSVYKSRSETACMDRRAENETKCLNELCIMVVSVK